MSQRIRARNVTTGEEIKAEIVEEIEVKVDPAKVRRVGKPKPASERRPPQSPPPIPPHLQRIRPPAPPVPSGQQFGQLIAEAAREKMESLSPLGRLAVGLGALGGLAIAARAARNREEEQRSRLRPRRRLRP